ncbi:hypothetical protein L6R52_42875, partial [Myxococcota bacterium]|nr:hypothetical protein [Myxococcota bacterium]
VAVLEPEASDVAEHTSVDDDVAVLEPEAVDADVAVLEPEASDVPAHTFVDDDVAVLEPEASDVATDVAVLEPEASDVAAHTSVDDDVAVLEPEASDVSAHAPVDGGVAASAPRDGDGATRAGTAESAAAADGASITGDGANADPELVIDVVDALAPERDAPIAAAHGGGFELADDDGWESTSEDVLTAATGELERSGATAPADDAGFVPLSDDEAQRMARRLAKTVEIRRPAITARASGPAEPSASSPVDPAARTLDAPLASHTEGATAERTAHARADTLEVPTDLFETPAWPRRPSTPGVTDYALIRAKGSEGSADLLPPPEAPLAERRPSGVLARITRPGTGDLSRPEPRTTSSPDAPSTRASSAATASGAPSTSDAESAAAALSSPAGTRGAIETSLRALPVEDAETFAIMDAGDEASEIVDPDAERTITARLVQAPGTAPGAGRAEPTEDDWAPVDAVDSAWNEPVPEPARALEDAVWAPIEELDRAIEFAQPEPTPTLDDADDLLGAQTLPTPRRDADEGSLLASDAEWIPALAAAEEALHTPMLPPPPLPRGLVAPDVPHATSQPSPSVTPVLPIRPLTRASRRPSPSVTPVLTLEPVRADAAPAAGFEPITPLTREPTEPAGPGITPVLDAEARALVSPSPAAEAATPSARDGIDTVRGGARDEDARDEPTTRADAGSELPVPALAASDLPSPSSDAALPVASDAAPLSEHDASALVSIATASFVHESTDSLASSVLPQTSWDADVGGAELGHEDWTPVELVARPRAERAGSGVHPISDDLSLEPRPRTPSVRTGGSADLAEAASRAALPRAPSVRAGG